MKLLIIFLSIALLGNAGAEVSGLYTYSVNADNASVTITDYPTTETGALVIVGMIEELPVTSIGGSLGCSLADVYIHQLTPERLIRHLEAEELGVCISWDNHSGGIASLSP